MSITDELREYVNQTPVPKSRVLMEARERFNAIADRIDAEHERVEQDLIDANNQMEQLCECSVELPKDADDVPICIGDVMELTRLSNKPSFEVRAMRYDEGGWEVYDRLGDRYAPSLLRHHHAPTVEDVLREFGIDWEHESDCEDRAALLKEYASKLRLAEGEDA